jgi:hypothetical protein
MVFDKLERKSIYRHDQLSQREIDAVKPLMESAFADEFSRYTGNRAKIGEERKNFVSAQYANRMRIANNMGVSPLYEDAQIFGGINPQLKSLFESYSAPANIIGMPNVSNPDSSNQHQGGIWNPAYKAGSGDLPSYVFGLQSHLALHCIGFDLLPVIAVDTPKVLLTYIDTVYGGGKFDEVGSTPSFIEISNSLFTKSWINATAAPFPLKRATSLIYLVSAANDAIKVRFVVGSTVKAALIVEVLGTGTVAGTAYIQTNTKSIKEIVDAINGSTLGKWSVGIDTAIGTQTSFTTQVGINYASAIRTNIAEAAGNNNKLGGMDRAQHEKGPKFKLNVISMDKQLEVVGKEIEADTTNIQIKDFAAMGVNVISHLYTGVQNQLVQTLDEIILDHLYRLGNEHAVGAYESQGLNYSLYIAAPGATKAVNTVPVVMEDMLENDVRGRLGTLTSSIITAMAAENQITYVDRLYARILLIAEFGSYQNRIAPYDFLVASGTICAALKKEKSFSIAPTPNTLSNSPELFYSGTLFENISIYKNPRIPFDDPRILMGRRGDDTDPGSKFIAYDLAASRQTISENTMAEKIRVWSRFAIADIGFYPELNYYTFLAINDGPWA